MSEFLDRDMIVIDVESNGLYGKPFCVGSVLMDKGGRVLDKFIGRCGCVKIDDEFVIREVLPSIESIPEGYSSLGDMEVAFIEWYATVIRARSPRPRVVVDAGFPVDMGFLYRLGTRGDNYGELWKTLSPWIYDLSSILAARGISPAVSRAEFASPLMGTAVGMEHDPSWDAEVSGLCVIRAMRKLPSCRCM